MTAAAIALAIALAIVLAMFFAGLGTAKMLAVLPIRHMAAHVGFSTAAYRRIGALEVAGAAGILVGLAQPRIGALAGAALLLLLAGALVSHRHAGDGLRDAIPALLAGLVVAAYLAVLWGGIR
jgi:hypothetical protein